MANAQYARRRAKILHHLGGKCSGCGSVDSLQVDHINKDEKSFDVGDQWSRPWEVLVVELDKCQLLCADCHKEKTRVDMGYHPEGTHGTLNMYSHKKCRCSECIKEWNSYHKDYVRELRSTGRTAKDRLAYKMANNPE